MSTVPALGSPAVGARPNDRRWLALAIIAVVQLMIIVDGSIVTIALPTAQRALGISTADRQWVITAYTLAFGGLLLLGGRIADYVGRKRVFVIGLIGFAAASAVGGLAQDGAMLFASRAVQGAFAAVMAPAALSLLAVTFTDPKERAKAFGVFGAIAGSGLAIGLIAGGVLVQYASWRWCLLVNVPIGLVTALAGSRVLTESKATGDAHYDIRGAVTATVGLVCLVYGMSEAASHGWASTDSVGFLVAAAALLLAFVVIELRVANPLLPLRVVTERNRGGSFLTSMLVGAGLFGMFLFLSYYLQGTLHYSALQTGFAFLPVSGGVIASAALASFLLPRMPPRVIMGIGLLLSIAGLLLFTQIGVHSAFVPHILPGELVMSVGLGLVFVPVTSVSLFGVHPNDAGVASALVNTTQQVGGSIGTALLNTVAISASAGYLATRGGLHATAAALTRATIHSYVTAFWVAGGLMAVGLVAVLVLVNAKTEDVPTGIAIPVADEGPAAPAPPSADPALEPSA
ncbi:MAG: MFS transporter [Acidimicrobiales bacterium]